METPKCKNSAAYSQLENFVGSEDAVSITHLFDDSGAVPGAYKLIVHHCTGNPTSVVEQYVKSCIRILKLLIDSGANVNAKDNEGYTVLHLAVGDRMTKIFDFLIEHGAKLDVSDPLDGSMIHHFIRTESFRLLKNISFRKNQRLEQESVDLLRSLIHKGLNVDFQDKNGNTALHLAADYNFMHTLPILLKHTKNPKIVNKNNMTALQTFAASVESFFDSNKRRIYDKGDPNYAEVIVHRTYETFLKKGFSVDVVDKSGRTPVHHALNQARHDGESLLIGTVKSMLKHFANVNAADKQGNTLLHILMNNIKENHSSEEFSAEYHKIFDILLSKGADVYRINNEGISPLIAVVVGHRLSMLKACKEYGVDLRYQHEGRNLLHYFCKSKFTTKHSSSADCQGVFDLLVNEGLDVDVKETQGKTLLHFAARYASVEVVKSILQSGTNVNSREFISDFTPLLEAVDFDREDLFQVLVEYGADVNAQNNQGQTVLHLAMGFKKRAMKKLMELSADIDVDSRDFIEGYTALHLAVLFDREDLIEMLMNYGADVNVRTDKGLTVLHLAVKHSDKNVVDQLIGLSTGIDLNCRDFTNGYTPLHMSVVYDREEIMEVLLDNGADVNARTNEGQTALLLCETWDSVAEQLIGFGAHVDVTGDDGLQPLHKAILRRDSHAIKKLLKLGADINDTVHALNVDCCKSVSRAISKHLIKLQAAELPIDEKLRRFISNTSDPESFYESCLKEAESLKSYMLSERVSLYEFLHMNRNAKSTLRNNKRLKKLANCSKLKKKFPMYYALISSAYEMATDRKEMLELAKDGWYELTSIRLPDLCLHEIFDYLNSASLRVLIDGANDRC